jgi:hypothetical protein
MEETNCIVLTGNADFPGGIKTTGGYRIASELRKSGYSVRVIDITVFNGFDDDLKAVLEKVISDKTLWIGFSTNFFSTLFNIPMDMVGLAGIGSDQPIIDFILLCRKLNPNMKIVAGGFKNWGWKQYNIHHFMSYSDTEVVDYTNWLAGKGTTDLSYHLGVTKGQEFKEFTSSRIDYEETDIMLPGMTLPIEISRGCIFRCKFCAFPLNGKTKGEWIKKAEVLRAEFLNNYERWGTTNYIFSDDTYNDSLDKVKLLYDEVFSKLPFKITWTSYLRLDLLMRLPEQVDYLRESGLRSAVFGIESINPQSAKIIGKGVPPMDQMDFIRDIRSNKWKNVLTSSGFIIGLPADTVNTARELDAFLDSERNPLDHWSINPLHIKPPHLRLSPDLNMTSEFELNFEKYGYYFPNGANGVNSHHWHNDKTGLNFKICARQARGIQDKVFYNPRWKNAGFGLNEELSCGVDLYNVIENSKEDIYFNRQQKSIDELKFEKAIEYKHALFKSVGLPYNEGLIPEAMSAGRRWKSVLL